MKRDNNLGEVKLFMYAVCIMNKPVEVGFI